MTLSPQFFEIMLPLKIDSVFILTLHDSRPNTKENVTIWLPLPSFLGPTKHIWSLPRDGDKKISYDYFHVSNFKYIIPRGTRKFIFIASVEIFRRLDCRLSSISRKRKVFGNSVQQNPSPLALLSPPQGFRLPRDTIATTSKQSTISAALNCLSAGYYTRRRSADLVSIERSGRSDWLLPSPISCWW